MKLPPSYQNTPGYISRKPRRALDIAVSKKTPLVRAALVHTVHSVPKRLPVIFKGRNFDSTQGRKHTLLAQLKERSVQDILWRLFRKTELYYRFVKRTVIRFTPDIAPHKMLYGSLIGGVAFGIVSMGFIEHFFGPGVFVRAQDSGQAVASSATGAITVGEDKNTEQTGPGFSEIDIFEYFNEATDAEYKEMVRKMVKGYPIEKMLPYIFEQDRLVSSFLIGIGKKESDWGKRVPVLDGQDCFNYWGYRGVRRLMGTGGHTCFNSSKDAVETVSKRLNTLIYSQELDTPEKMIVWKCGFSCSGHSAESVKKWISDVAMYYDRLKGK